ncbi:MAG: UvrD-helicase domain-containing protein [bacterium]|nr:UvrD-helicase domain-containing protein [Candidatus Neomarinimicrobiota bacterium]MDX9779406.1 UvrD-helicase domain-containing protein [bacterium]
MERTPLELALDVSRSVFIQACAGAGKTFALTKRYAAILDSFARETLAGVKPEQTDHKKILVITFTKKAAGEMIKRIQKDVNILLSGEEIRELKGTDFCPTLRNKRETAVRNYAKKLKDTFSQNSISTIDSFCARILREFAHKMDLDPQFNVQEDAESQKLLDESLEKWLKKRIAADPHCFDILLEEMGFYQIRSALRKMHAAREILEDYVRGIEQKNEQEIWHDWLSRYTARGDIEGLIRAFELMWREQKDKCKDENDVLYRLLGDMADKLENIRSLEDPLEFRAAFLSEVVNRNGGFIKSDKTYKAKAPGNKDKWENGKDFAEEWFELLRNFEVEDILQTPGTADKKIIPLLKQLIAHYRDFNAFYSEIKKQKNVMDFSDVIIRTQELLQKHKDVRDQIGRRYSHIMLDEFQDTNPLRWDIVRMIFRASGNAKLFIVGDRKQSIFRFANADVTVMNNAETLVRDLQGDVLEFNDNYRSSANFVAEGINAYFSKILGNREEHREAYEAFFEPTNPVSGKEPIPDAIEAHWLESGDADSDEYLPAQHAAMQVRTLLKKYENSSIDPKDGTALIAVILRRFTNINEYLNAFRKWGIPIDIMGGKGFFDSPAVRDVFHFLSVMDNPHDDHALAGLLRSPFLALSDAEIHSLSKRDKGVSLYNALQAQPGLAQTSRLLAAWIRDAGIKPLDELITGILDQNDRELGYVSELMPQQQLANLDKAVNIIRGLQRKGGSLRSIREFFRYQVKGLSDESQALYPATAKVHILTVHKAKGLQYPIVVLPEMNHSGTAISTNIRLGRSGEHHEIALSLQDEKKPGILLRLKGIANLEEEAEDKRVFYVALTRAVYKVLFLGEQRDKTYKNTWWSKYVLETRDLDIKDPENWPVDYIRKHCIDEIAAEAEKKSIGCGDWIPAPQYATAGRYLYRSPHDLMGDTALVFSGEKEGYGAAKGSLYHYCIEKGIYEISGTPETVETYIRHQFPAADREELLSALRALLEKTRSHPVYQILKDPDIEQYRELPLRGWLRKKADTIQVSGTIDLLYRTESRWMLVDFKTDSSKDRLMSYQKQIRTYLWMLKQVYGICACGKLYFVALNEMIDIDWDEHYFDRLPVGPGFRPGLPDSGMEISSLKEKIGKEAQHLFCVSSYHEEQIYLALVKAGCMRPNIRITTLGKWIRSGNIPGTPHERLRMMVLKNNENLKPGTADYLAAAIRDHELGKGEIRPEFRDDYRRIAADPAYRPASAIYAAVPPLPVQAVFIDPAVPAAPDKELIETVKTRTAYVELSLKPKGKTGRPRHINAFSPREEVIAVAGHIREHCREEEDILIAVSSMDKYAPHLKRIFPQFGLQLRFTEALPLSELPCNILLLDFLNAIRIPDPQWQDLAAVLLHPLCRPDDTLYRFDKKVRANPQECYELPEKAKEFIRNYTGAETWQLRKKVQEFISDLDIPELSLHKKICKKFLELLDTVIEDLDAVFHDTGFALLCREMAVRIKNTTVPRQEQWNGIPVVGFLDSLGSVPGKLYVMGMNEGDIPRAENENPCLNLKGSFSLDLNHHFMEYWLSLGKRVIFSSARHSEDGSDQNLSTFLEEVETLPLNLEYPVRRDILLAYEDCILRGTDHTLVRRHNEIVSGERGVFSGQTNEHKNAFRLSVTQVDALLACPQRFYYDNILCCSPADTEEHVFQKKLRGTVIHKVLERFGSRGGFEREARESFELLQNSIESTFAEMKIDITDPYQRDLYRDYLRDLNPDSGSNALALAIRNHRQSFDAYRITETEKRFRDFTRNYGGVRVLLSGVIDAILTHRESRDMVVSDYKTMKVKLNLLNACMLSQLYFYLQKCREDFPAHTIRAAYEIVGKAEFAKIHQFSAENGRFEQIVPRNAKGFGLEEFEAYLEDLFLQIGEGKYYITERAFKDACEYCPHEGLCRKTTRTRTGQTGLPCRGRGGEGDEEDE